jgi:hypothetical protein
MIIAVLALLYAQAGGPEHGIPAAYHGVWDVSPAFCDEPVSDMRLGISSAEFTVYRDQFQVHRVTPKDDGTLVVNVSFRSHDAVDDEPSSEPYDLVWKLSDSGNDLTMTSRRGATTWHRCPNKRNGE